MESLQLWKNLGEKVAWVKQAYDLMSEEERYDAFYKTLEFGTAGMRGLLGIGPNRMNVYTVAKANVGFGQYLVETFKGEVETLKVAIAYDNRHQSREFAQVSARILSTYGIESYVFEKPRPTPELSFAVRELGCVGGIVVTASHNPKEYNGYKVYDETGCQLVDHKIARVIECVNAVGDETKVDLEHYDDSLVHGLDEAFDVQYLDKIKSIALRNEPVKDLKVVFSSQHGTSYPLVPDVLKELGYDVVVVEEQKQYDPDFTNTKSPNPEDKRSYELPLEYARKVDADLVLVCDPDADRMGICVKHHGTYEYLTGNQGGAVLQEYIYSTHRDLNTMPANPVMFNTVVTSDLGEKIAKSYDVSVEKTLTGFKYIGEKIEHHNTVKDKTFVFGYEESYGYLLADFVRDKDALQACVMVVESANYYHNQGMTLVDVLESLYETHGAYADNQIALTLSGAEGLSRISRLLDYFRTSDIKEIDGIEIVKVDDFLDGSMPEFPQSNVIKYHLENGSWIAIRPSGTEPKCKFYYCASGATLKDAQEMFERLSNAMQRHIDLVA